MTHIVLIRGIPHRVEPGSRMPWGGRTVRITPIDQRLEREAEQEQERRARCRK